MIKIDDTYSIEANNYGYVLVAMIEPIYDEKTLKRLKNLNKKPLNKPVRKELGYYTTLEGAFNALKEKKISDFIGDKEKEVSLQDVIKAIKDWNKLISQMVKGEIEV